MSRYVQQITWDDCPHITEAQKAELRAAIPPHQLDARTKGIPILGSGAIYPVPESDILVDPFVIPDWMCQVYALDVGWNRTAAIWGAIDRDSDVVYLYSEHYRGQAEPAVHAQAIKSRGDWIPGVIDPASRGRQQADGEQLLRLYRDDLGLSLVPADNAVEAGIYEVWTRLSTGRLKIFKTLQNWLAEYRIYRRDEKGKVVKENDHLMDACVVGGTLVQTDDGPIAMRDLVGRSGWLISRSGSRARFLGARLTIEDAPVISLSFDDDSVVTCTPDHPFLTPQGWVRADCMFGVGCYNGVAQRIQARQWSKSLARQFRNTGASVTTSVANTFNAMVCGFTALCGLTPTAQSQRVSTFTTRMPTERITNLIISSYCLGRTTRATTRSDTEGQLRHRPSKPQRLGMDQSVANNGIASTTKRIAICCTRFANSVVSNAASGLRRGIPALIAFARRLARRDGALILALTMRNAVAWLVASLLWRISTWRRRLVRENVLVRCNRVQSAGRADVYCLTVPGTSAFAVESGLLVHNTRYLCMTGLRIAHIRPAEMWTLHKRGQKVQHEIDYQPMAEMWKLRK